MKTFLTFMNIFILCFTFSTSAFGQQTIELNALNNVHQGKKVEISIESEYDSLVIEVISPQSTLFLLDKINKSEYKKYTFEMPEKADLGIYKIKIGREDSYVETTFTCKESKSSKNPKPKKNIIEKASNNEVPYTSNISLLQPMLEPKFKDLSEGHWAHQYIIESAKLGFSRGTPDGNFLPDEYLGLQDTMTFLDRLLVYKKVNFINLSRTYVENKISKDDGWAYESIRSVGSKLSQSTFETMINFEKEPITRELLAQIIFEITQGELPRIKDWQEFSDISESDYQEAIRYCVETGVLEGVGNKTMLPQKALTRAELITILLRLNQIL